MDDIPSSPPAWLIVTAAATDVIVWHDGKDEPDGGSFHRRLDFGSTQGLALLKRGFKAKLPTTEQINTQKKSVTAVPRISLLITMRRKYRIHTAPPSPRRVIIAITLSMLFVLRCF
jgi:hypothetical protein